MGIPVHLKTPVTTDMVRGFEHSYDVAVVATGARVTVDKGVPGAARMLIADDVMNGRVECGQNVVVLGGGQVGLCVAEYLASVGRDVTVVEEGKRIAEDAIPTWKWRHSSWVEELNIRVFTQARVKSIGDADVTIVNKKGEEVILPADSIVAGAPRKSQQSLFHDLEFLVDEVHLIGDAVAPRSLHNAIHEGFKLGTRV